MTSPAIERQRIVRRHRTRFQRRAENELADHPYRVELLGRLGALQWPNICASCGADTYQRLTVRKVFGRPRSFTRRRSTYQRQIITAADIPYCESCVARHRGLVPSRSLLADGWHMLWPVLIPMAGSGFFFQLSLRLALQEHSRGTMAAKYVWGLPALFAFILAWCLVIAWWSSRALRVERQTEVTRACDFSDDVSWTWERERRIYALGNQRFARALADANAARVWTSGDDARSFRVATAVFGLGAIALAVAWLLLHAR
jgi:hypothetical protein